MNGEALHELALFAGAGGGILGGHLLGWRTICAVEFDTYAASVLVARQNDGHLPPFPVWDDVRTFDGRPWRGIAQVISGGFPCQDISAAGKGAGIDGERSGLWREFARIIGEVRPQYVFVENSPVLTSRGLGRVLGDLAALGFDAEWGVVSACMLGAPHSRERLFLAANSDENIMRTSGTHETQATAANVRYDGIGEAGQMASWWQIQPEPCSLDDGVPGLVDELRPYGNAQVPVVAAIAWRILSARLHRRLVDRQEVHERSFITQAKGGEPVNIRLYGGRHDGLELDVVASKHCDHKSPPSAIEIPTTFNQEQFFYGKEAVGKSVIKTHRYRLRLLLGVPMQIEGAYCYDYEPHE